jgi:hypothetical protein
MDTDAPESQPSQTVTGPKHFRLSAVWAAMGFIGSKLWGWPVVGAGTTALYGLGVGALFGDEYIIALCFFLAAIAWLTGKTLHWEDAREHKQAGWVTAIVVVFGVILCALSLAWVLHRFTTVQQAKRQEVLSQRAPAAPPSAQSSTQPAQSPDTALANGQRLVPQAERKHTARAETPKPEVKPEAVDPRIQLLDEARQFIKVMASMHDDLEAQIIKCGEDSQQRWEFEKAHLPPEKLESTHKAISDISAMQQREIRRKFSERYHERYQAKALDLRERLRVEVPGVAQEQYDMDYKSEYGGYPVPDTSGQGLQDYNGIVQDLTNLANALDNKIKRPR